MSRIELDTWNGPEVRLAGRTVVVVGGSGGVGEGVVRSTLASGATVVATGRDRGRLEELARRMDAQGVPGSLRVRVLDAMDPSLGAEVEALVGELGAPDAVVVSVASWGDQGRKPALALTDDEWDHLLEGNLTSVFRLFRAFLPVLAPGGSLIQLNGMSADIPFPGNAGVALSAAATKSLSLTLAAELGARGPRVHQVILGVIRTRARQEAGIDDPRWIDATQVGEHVAGLVDGSSPLSGSALHYFTDRATGPLAGPGTR
jgi:NAD(P)-dependent dehydrogenase (short-subunit alcohol dehydrogenase family)